MKKNNQLTFFKRPQKRNSYEEICGNLAGKSYLNPDEFGKALRAWSGGALKQDIKIVALFSGAGGLDIGFCDAGFKLIESVELEAKFVKSMLFNQENGHYFQGANILCEDIRKYKAELDEKIDFVIGGPPCQSFSAAGRRAAGVAGTRDDRGSLFEEYVRVIQKLKPKGFLFENVYGLLGAEKGESIKKIVQAFKEIGYNTTYRVLDAADYGTPQHRERIIIVGSAEIVFKFPKPTHGIDSKEEIPHFSAQQALNALNNIHVDTTTLNGRFGHLLSEVPPGLNYSFFTEKMGHPEPIFAWRSKFSDFLYKADPLVPIRTLKASGGQYTGPFHWENRHFTVQELKRLQTFPDDYEIVGNKAVASKQIGNSVPPQFARMLAISVLDQFFDIKLPFDLVYLDQDEPLSFRNLKRDKSKAYSKAAIEALDKRDVSAEKKILPEVFKVELQSNFKLIAKDDAVVKVEFNPTLNNWSFTLRENNSKKTKEVYRVEISNNKKSPLFAQVSSIALISHSTRLQDYTLLWKLLEQTLSQNNFKADLVQLNGYYQYTNQINYRMTAKMALPSDNVWKVIEMILVDPRIGQIIDINVLAANYELSSEDLILCFMELREIGFEIRNSSTNKEMDINHYLIPYKFPTLTPLSVQLKKSLN